MYFVIDNNIKINAYHLLAHREKKKKCFCHVLFIHILLLETVYPSQTTANVLTIQVLAIEHKHVRTEPLYVFHL